MYLPTTSESSAGDSSSESSSGPSRKICRSPTTTVTSSILASGALVPSHDDLLPLYKRFRDSISPKDSVEEDTDADLETRSLIAGGKRANLLEQVASLERSNARLRGTVLMESARADRFRRHMSFMGSELRQICRFRYYDKMRFRRLETFIIMTITRSGMTLEVIKELINQQVAEALAAYEANRTTELAVECQSQNRNDDENRNVRGNGNGNGGGNGNGNDGGNGNEKGGGNRNENPNRIDRGVMPVACEYTYDDFNAHKRTIGADVSFAMSWRELIKLMTKVYCLRNEIQKMESELWNLTVKNNDLAAYT
ncbi:hypothetical protein Tco_0505819 [Tanacetum coccineum]